MRVTGLEVNILVNMPTGPAEVNGLYVEALVSGAITSNTLTGVRVVGEYVEALCQIPSAPVRVNGVYLETLCQFTLYEPSTTVSGVGGGVSSFSYVS